LKAPGFAGGWLLAETAACAHRFEHQKNYWFNDFVDRFVNRFEDNEVPLLSAIDESPRILRRLKSLRGLSHEEVKQVFPQVLFTSALQVEYAVASHQNSAREGADSDFC
jgi:hypothetical protein